MARQGNAAFTWTTSDGQDAVHLLGRPLDTRSLARHHPSFSHTSADGTSINTVRIGSGLWEMVAEIRYDPMPYELLMMLDDGAAQQTLTYYEDLTAANDDGLAAKIVPSNALSLNPDPDFWFKGEYEYAVLLRRTDGKRFGSVPYGAVLGNKVVHRYRGGMPLDTNVWTYTHTATTGADTYRKRDGTIGEVTADNTIRTHWVDPDGDGVLEKPSALLEPSRENLLLQSEDFGTTWTASNTTVTTDQVVAPDGASTADKVAADGAVNSEFVRQDFTTNASAVRYTASFWIRSGDFTQADFGIYDLDTATFPNQTATVLEGSGSVAGTARQIITGLTSGWTRVAVTLDAAATATNTLRLSIYPGDATATSAGYVYLWGAQAEEGAFATSYIATTTSTVTRAVDVASTIVPSAVTSPTAAWTRYTKWVAGMDGDGGLTTPRLVQIGDAGGAQLRVDTGSTVRLLHFDGSTNDSDTLAATIARGDTCEAVLVWNGDGTATLYLWVNGTFIDSATLSGITPASAWEPDGSGDVRSYLNSRNGGNNAGAMELLDDVMVAGAATGYSAAQLYTAFTNYVDQS